MQLALIAFCVAAASVTAQYVVTFWMILFVSHNLRTIAELARPQSAVEPGRARVTGEVYRSRAYFESEIDLPSVHSFGASNPKRATDFTPNAREALKFDAKEDPDAWAT